MNTQNTDTDTFSTTRIQRAYFVGRQPDLPLGGLECAGYMTFDGKEVDEQRLFLAIEKISAIPALRMRFRDPDTLTLSQISVPDLKVHHCSREQETEHGSLIRKRMLSKSVDLSSGQIWGIELTKWDDGKSTLHIVISLAMVDLQGLSALMSHLARCYLGECLPPEFCSVDQLYHQLNENRTRIERKREQSRTKLMKLSKGRMDTLPPPPDLPFTTFKLTHVNAELANVVTRRSKFYPLQEWSKIQKYASTLGVATSALILALYTRALRLCSTASDFVVTVTNLSVTGSDIQLAERTVTYAHRSRSAVSLKELVKDTHEELHYRLLRGVDSETELRHALTDTTNPHPGISPYIFTYGAQRPVFGKLITDTFGLPGMWGQTPQTVIDCQVIQPTEQHIEVAFDVRRAAIPADIDQTVFSLLTESIDDIIAGRPVENTLPIESLTWRFCINASPVASSPAMLFSAFRRQVQKRPQAIALISSPSQSNFGQGNVDPLIEFSSEKQQWSYMELDLMAMRLAARLIEHCRAGDIIGICLPKGPSQIVAVLAIMYAGCTYLPVGLDMPGDRRNKIRQRSGMRYLVTTEDFALLDQQKPLSQLRLSEGCNTSEGTPDALAYVIFTSGSTGEPKGVAVSHRAANNTIVDINNRHNMSESDVLLAVSSLDFDLSVYDIFGPLSCGATIVTINEDERRDAFRWAELVKTCQVTLWNSVPALASMLAAATDYLPSVRTWLCSGDWIAPSLFADLQSISPESILVAMGGSTEAAIWSNEYVVRSAEDLKAHWSSVPYGLPLSGQQYRVVRENEAGCFVDCPDGVRGELWIGGEGLAQGYLGDPERTSERFVYARDASDAEETRWYRTGDLGYWREGLLFFVGRMDTQVKIQGHRVECGEIEQALINLSGIDNAVVVPIRQRRALGAIIVGNDLLPDQLRQQLSRLLPHYMIPERFLNREQLQLSRNGKVDRQWASRELDNEESEPQCNSISELPTIYTICLEVWRQVLGRDNISTADNFFALGGDSLAATRVCVLLQTQGVQVAVGELFAANTLEDFALRCQTNFTQQTDDINILTVRQEPFPLTSLQRAYALGADGIPGVSRCDTVFSVILRNTQNYPLIYWQQALDALIRDTAALRIVRLETHQQVVDPRPVSVVTLSEHSDLQTYLSYTPLDSRTHLPIRLVFVKGDTTRVGMMFNYLALDALSLIRITLALIERVAGVENGYQLDPHIVPFLHYTSQLAGHTVPTSLWDSRTWQPPELLSAPVIPAVSRIKSITRYLSSKERRWLEVQAKNEQVTLSAKIFKALGSSLITLCNRQELIVVVPVCWRPPNSPQALGQFTQLRLCRYAANFTTTDVYRELGDAVAGKTPDDHYIATRGRAVYPFVFTSTVGIPEVESIYRQDAPIYWSHTRTPGVLIDCQVLPCSDGLEIRWDYADGTLEHSQLTAAHRLFMSQLIPDVGSSGGVACPAYSPESLIAGLSGHQIAGHAIAAALKCIDNVPSIFAPVIDAWKQLELPAAEPVWHETGHFLASCINGERLRNDLLHHPFLAPEQLLLASLRQIVFFESMIAELREEYLCRSLPGSELNVMILGSGSGVFGKLLMEVATRNSLPISLNEHESNKIFNAPQTNRKPSGKDIPDVVIAPASLHRDDGLLAWLAEIVHVEQRTTPVRIHILEITQPDAASLIAALLDPTLIDTGQSPLLTPSTWGRRLEEIGAEVEHMQRPADNLVWIKAILPVTPHLETQSQASVLYSVSTDVETQVAACWKIVLGLDSPPVPSADFFALGGDSLGATKIVMELRQQGFGSIRVADLFNHPVFDDFVNRIQTQRILAPQPAICSEQLLTYPLTSLQKAYLSGRSPEQLLGGVASHCYFEFTISEPDGIDTARWQQAVCQVVARHDALRSRIVWLDGEPFGQVTKRVTCLPEVTPNVRALTESETPEPTQDYPLRVRISEDGKTIGIGMDNLMLDGSSMFLVMRELGDIYQGKQLSPPATITYAQYRHSRQDKTSTKPKIMPSAPNLPWLSSLEMVKSIHFARSAYDVEVSQWLKIRQWASLHRITPAALLLAAYALEIAEIALDSEFSLNVTTFERDPDVPDVASLVGDFTQLGLVAFAPSSGARTPEQRSQSLLEQARVAHQGILTIHDRPEQVCTLRIGREIVRQQGEPIAGLFPVVFTSGLGLDADTHRSDDFGFGTMTYARSQTPQVAMDFQVHDDIRGLHITVDYVTTLLATELVDALTRGVADRLRELVTIAKPAESETTALSTTIARIWCEYLPEAGEETPDNFFQAGGDSLQATRCIRALQKEIDPGISLRLLLVYPRFSDFCEQVAQLVEKKETGQVVAATKMSDFDEGML